MKLELSVMIGVKMFKKHKLEDQFVVSILSEDFSYFMANEAYK